MDVLEDLPAKTLYRLFKENIGKAEMLTYVFLFNALTPEDEINFCFGNNDIQQWNVSNNLLTILEFINIWGN